MIGASLGKRRWGLGLVLGLALGPCLAPTARAQMGMPMGPNGMPDLRFMNGKSRPDPSDAPGTVTVRIVRKTFASPAAGIEVTLLGKNAGGDVRKRSAKTNDQGRAVFDSVAPGSTVSLEAKVDGEVLRAEPFTQPEQAGIRTLLVAGVGTAPTGSPPAGAGSASGSDADQGGEGADFNQGIATGQVRVDPTLAAGTIQVKAFDRDGRPLAGQIIELGQVGGEAGQKVKVTRKPTAVDGTVSFTGLPLGKDVGYAVVMPREGTRLGTQAFALPETGGGVAAEVRVVGRTANPEVISVGEGARIVIELNEDIVQVLEFLPLVNDADAIFDAEPGGYPIPLPREFVGAEGAEGDVPVEVRKGFGVAAHIKVPPGPPPALRQGHAPNEVRFGFTVPVRGSTLDLEQPLPGGMGAFTFIAQKVEGLDVKSPSFEGPRSEKVLGGHTFYVWPASAIGRGGVLSLRITGLPSNERPGRTVAATLVGGLVLAAIVLSRRPGAKKARSTVEEHDKLVSEREHLFEELVALERKREASAASEGGTIEAAWQTERKKLVTRLEAVLRALGAGAEESPSEAPPAKAVRVRA